MTTSPLAYSTRKDHVEGIHRGAVVVVKANGDLLYNLGNPDYGTFLRSSIKMVQAIPVIESGAAEKFEFNDAALAVCCASHTAADYHVTTVRTMLEKMGLGESALKCGGHLPEDKEMRERLIRLQATPTAIYNNCSGKHAGMLAVCLANDWPTEGYLEIEHPLQQRILELIAEYTELKKEEIPLGIDGCSLPTYFMKLRNAGLGAARFIERGEKEKTPERRLLEAMTNRPEMVHSEGGFDTELIRALNGRCYAKRGAMGIMLFGLRTEEHGPIGIAAKMENGNNKPMPVVMISLLDRLGLISPEEGLQLERFRKLSVKNWNGIYVGEIKGPGVEESRVGESGVEGRRVGGRRVEESMGGNSSKVE